MKTKGIVVFFLICILFSGGNSHVEASSLKKDTVRPKLYGLKTRVVSYGVKFDPKKGVKAKDNRDGNITKRIKIKGKVNTKKIGRYKLTYSVLDSSKNRASKTIYINIKDRTTPKIKLLKGNLLNIKQGDPGFNTEKYFSATDNVDGNIKNKVLYNDINIDKIGKKWINLSVKDKAGNRAEEKILVNIIRIPNPTISVQDITLLSSQWYGDDFDEEAINEKMNIIVRDYWGNLITDFEDGYDYEYDHDVIFPNNKYSILAKDKYGNRSKKWHTVFFKDNMAPVLYLNSNKKIPKKKFLEVKDDKHLLETTGIPVRDELVSQQTLINNTKVSYSEQTKNLKNVKNSVESEGAKTFSIDCNTADNEGNSVIYKLNIEVTDN